MNRSNRNLFDRTLLPPALFEFVVISDTHYILNPEPYAVEFGSVRTWPERVERALSMAAALDAEFAIHLGDLTEENPAKPEHCEARRRALQQIERSGLKAFHLPGNMDIGDKPDAAMFADWVSQETLDIYHQQLGPSWYSFDRHHLHFVLLNSQIMNGPLPAAGEQASWLERDLEENHAKRIFVFMHLPPFFVDQGEPDRGFYNSLDEPARGWLLGLLANYEVELLFCGHTHFRVFNRAGCTELRVCASTTTSRAGFYEAFSVPPPEEQGRNDRAKLGFYLVRVHEERCSVHFIRTESAGAGPGADRKILLTLNSAELQSPLGVYLRRPLAQLDEGTVAWPSALRQRVRDDHPLLACLEGGIGQVRLPASDLTSPLQRERLELLRGQGVAISAFWLWHAELPLAQLVQPHLDLLDAIEVQLTGALRPDEHCLKTLAACREMSGKEVVVAPYLAREVAPGKYHPRARIGYRREELAQLDEHLCRHRIELDRVLCHLDDTADPLEALGDIGRSFPLRQVRGFDLAVELPGTDEQAHANRVAAAVFAAAATPGSRLFLSPYVDLDRTNDVNHGLLDRLSNPRPAYHVARSLSSLLCPEESLVLNAGFTAAASGSYRIAAAGSKTARYLLILADGPERDGNDDHHRLAKELADQLFSSTEKIDLFDLGRGESEPELAGSGLAAALAGSRGPWLLRQRVDQ